MHKDKILKLLMSSKGYVSGAELASKLTVSRTAIWKHIKTLEREGFDIEAVPSQGYRLRTMPDVLLKSDIERDLKTRIIGKDIRLLPEVVSTNTLGMEMAARGAPEGTVVIAERQTGGRGRLGRTWISPKGNVYLSVILRPDIPTHKAPLITLMGAVATASAIRKECEVPAAIKWPNDILFAGKKAAGLLTEMSAEPDRIKHIVLGIGIDVNMDLEEIPSDIRKLTTTLAAEAGGKIGRARLIQRLFTELERWYLLFLKNPAPVIEEWKSLNMTVGNRVAVSGGQETFEGIAQGIDNEGRLILKLGDGTLKHVAAGDVAVLK